MQYGQKKKKDKRYREKCIKQFIKEGDEDVCFHYFYSIITKESRKWGGAVRWFKK